MDKDKNLEQFFRKRVQDFDPSGGDWDVPDRVVFENAQLEFPNRPAPKSRRRGVLIWGFAGILIASLLTYIFYLQRKVEIVAEELQIAKTEIQQQNFSIEKLKKEASKNVNDLVAKNEVAQKTIENLTQKNIQPQKQIFKNFTKKNTLTAVNEQLTILKNQQLLLAKAPESTLDESPFKQSDFELPQVLNFEKAIPFLASTNKRSSKLPQNLMKTIVNFDVPAPTKKPISFKKRSRQFEFGISFSALNYQTPWVYDFEKSKDGDWDKNLKKFSLPSYGGRLNIAFAVQPSLWLTTGLRRTKGSFIQFFETKLQYDKSKEYTDDAGKNFSALDWTATSGFSDSGSRIDFEIPNGLDIEDEKYLEASGEYAQEYEFMHIPLGFNFFLGKNKWQGVLTTGVGWNKIEFGKSEIEGHLNYDSKIIPFQKREAVLPAKQFFNGFASVGLDYAWTKNIHTRVLLFLEKDFIQQKEKSGFGTLGRTLDIGLNYRF